MWYTDALNAKGETFSELENPGGGVRCPNCGYRVSKKTRFPIVKRMKSV
jgi:DNA-directed RNA polymerase subunit RPC12/RpoP